MPFAPTYGVGEVNLRKSWDIQLARRRDGMRSYLSLQIDRNAYKLSNRCWFRNAEIDGLRAELLDWLRGKSRQED